MDGINGFEREKRDWQSWGLKAIELREFYQLPPMLPLLLFADVNGRAKVMVKAA